MAPPKDRTAIPSWLAIATLVAIGLGLRLWVIARTEVAARDSIGFIRMALRFEHEPWIQVVKTSEQPPGYALTVLAVSRPLRALQGETTVDTMVLAAQLASALMAVLSIVPMVLLGRELSDRRIGWLGAGLMLALPGVIRLTSDGLSEATFLFWMATALWLGVRALRRPGAMRMLWCGLAIAAAYLTRPEALELAVVAGVTLLAMQFSTRRQAWSRAALQLGALACGVLVGVGPYFGITGHLTNKNTGQVLVGDSDADPRLKLPYSEATPPGAVHTLLAVWARESQHQNGPRWLWAAKALAQETAQGFQYFGLALALFGLCVWRLRSGSLAGGLLIGGLAALHALILCRMAMISGYLSERHVLMFVLAGSFPAAAALLWLGGRVRFSAAFTVACGLLVILLAAELPVLAKPLHGNRIGHKAAGRWLANVVTDDDLILDPYNWAEFYAHRPLPPAPPDHPQRWFVVLEQSENSHSRLPGLTVARKIAAVGDLAYHWPETADANSAQVVVYQVTAAQMGQER